MEKILIISPQAGLCNRFRAICSAIAIAEITNRKLMIYWPKWTTRPGEPFEHYFETDIPYVPNDINIDVCFTEWLPDSGWYSSQSEAQRNFKVKNVINMGNVADIILTSTKKVILIETSLSLSLSNQNNWKDNLTRIYQKLKPTNRYLSILKTIPNYDIGISIRKNFDFIRCFPLSYQSEEKIKLWIETIKKKTTNIVLFSDDDTFPKKLNLECKLNFDKTLDWGFMQFLILAFKCNKIYGTPKSSFPFEASMYGNKEFQTTLSFPINPLNNKDTVIAILAKNKAKYLPFYLKCIEEQTIEPSKIHIYIKTNNNTDNTEKILKEWIKTVKNKYASIYFNSDNVSENVERFKEHEWNEERFRVLSKIRQDSIDYAITKNCNYFVVDCDNFIKPFTLEDMIKTGREAISPLLIRDGSSYSNYHHCCDENGYYNNCKHYNPILKRQLIDIHLSDVIHCTYFLRNEILSKISYTDESTNHEYVIFSRNLRKLNIPQFIDNRKIYGYVILENENENSVKKIELLMSYLSEPVRISINKTTKIYYGVENNYLNVTDICYSELYFNNKIIIPYGDFNRSYYFGDPKVGVLKSIKIEDHIYDLQEIEIHIRF